MDSANYNEDSTIPNKMISSTAMPVVTTKTPIAQSTIKLSFNKKPQIFTNQKSTSPNFHPRVISIILNL